MSQRQITLPTDDLNLILDLIMEKKQDLCEESMQELVSNGGIGSSSIDKRNELVDNITRINKHIVMTFKTID